MHLQFWVESAYAEDSWQKRLPEKRLEAAMNLRVERKRSDEAISLLDCLQFCDKAAFLIESPNLLATELPPSFSPRT